MPIKLCTVVGARPQFVKAGAISRCLRSFPSIRESLIHTGQHYDDLMSEIFFREMEIPAPIANLHIGGGSHGQNTGRMIEAIEEVLIRDRYDLLLVYGDTDSTLASAIAASKLNIPILHVEAGLRSFRRSMPEEINRVLTDHVAAALYTPSQAAITNLVREGIPSDRIVPSGDVMLDVCKFFLPRAIASSDVVKSLALVGMPFYVATIHRKENTDVVDNLRSIIKGFADSGEIIVFPIHPRTSARIAGLDITLPSNVKLIQPLGYLDMLALVNASVGVLTDSGGLQKEAYFLGKPCLTLREETEWIELVEIGWNRVVGTDSGAIAAAMASRPVLGDSTPVYGDGDAALKICADIARRFS